MAAELGPLEARIVALIDDAGETTPAAIVTAIRREFGKKETPASIRFALDWLASRGLIVRTPASLAVEPTWFSPKVGGKKKAK